MGDLSGVDWNETGILPVGEYRAVVVKAPLTTTKAGDGNYLAMDLQIISGPHKNEHVFQNVMMHHPKPHAVAMGRQQLSGLCKSIGIKTETLQDTSELLNKPVRIVVFHEEDKGYGPSASVKKFMTDVGGTPEGEEAAAPW